MEGNHFGSVAAIKEQHKLDAASNTVQQDFELSSGTCRTTLIILRPPNCD
jgi:hypothetical protein